MKRSQDPEIIRAKWIMDGATTFAEAIQKVEQFKDYIKQLQEDGYELISEVQDDYGFYEKR